MTRQTVLAALVLATAAACSSPANETPRDTAASPPPAATAAAPIHDGRPVEIAASDTMKFDVTEITARPGEKLSVTLVNRGTMPKFSMGHNWVLLVAGVDTNAFAISASESPTTDYVPGAMKDRVLASTRLLGPNERDTVTFAAPAAPGRYEFLCSFPGHFQVGMRGVLIVK